MIGAKKTYCGLPSIRYHPMFVRKMVRFSEIFFFKQGCGDFACICEFSVLGPIGAPENAGLVSDHFGQVVKRGGCASDVVKGCVLRYVSENVVFRPYRWVEGPFLRVFGPPAFCSVNFNS